MDLLVLGCMDQTKSWNETVVFVLFLFLNILEIVKLRRSPYPHHNFMNLGINTEVFSPMYMLASSDAHHTTSGLCIHLTRSHYIYKTSDSTHTRLTSDTHLTLCTQDLHLTHIWLYAHQTYIWLYAHKTYIWHTFDSMHTRFTFDSTHTRLTFDTHLTLCTQDLHLIHIWLYTHKTYIWYTSDFTHTRLTFDTHLTVLTQDLHLTHVWLYVHKTYRINDEEVLVQRLLARLDLVWAYILAPHAECLPFSEQGKGGNLEQKKKNHWCLLYAKFTIM